MRSRPPAAPKRSVLRLGSIAPFALAGITLAGVVAVSLKSYSAWAKPTTARATPVARRLSLPSPAELELAIRRVGLTPETLAAAGLSGPDVTALVQAGRGYLNEHQSDLELADWAVLTAQNEADRLQRLVESGQAKEQDVAALPGAQAALAGAKQTRDAILSGLYDEAVGALSIEQRSALAKLKFNSAWDLPTQYLMVNRPEPQWVALREDLTNLRVAGQLGEDPDPAAVQAVNAAGADPAVSAAATNLSNRSATVNAAWREALGG